MSVLLCVLRARGFFTHWLRSGHRPPNRYIFNHIPKTGGMSLLETCRQNLPAADISPHVIGDDVIAGLNPPLESYRLIAGHFSLGVHARLSGNRYSMTMLRDPIRTILSSYIYWRSADVEFPLIAKAKQLPFDAYVRCFRDDTGLIRNRFTHHFAMFGKDFPDDPSQGPSLLAAAKHNLTAFHFVGICEEFEDTARLLCQELGWRRPATVPYVNRSHSEDSFDSIDRETMGILLESNGLDYELYEYGKALFRARLERHSERAAGSVEPNHFVPFVLNAPQRKAEIQGVAASWVSRSPSPMLDLEIRFHTRIQDTGLVLGVAIYDAAGNNVWGTNTGIENLQLRHEANHDGVAHFVLEFNAPAGAYSVTAAIHQLSRPGFHEHWIDEATRFEVPPGHPFCDAPAIRLLEFRSVSNAPIAPTSVGRDGPA